MRLILVVLIGSIIYISPASAEPFAYVTNLGYDYSLGIKMVTTIPKPQKAMKTNR